METKLPNQTLVSDFECNPTDGSYCAEYHNHTHVFMERPNDMLDPFHINPAFLPIVITHAITFIVGIIGNFVVIATWARGGKLRSPTATFLVSLACADLLLLFIYVPLETLEYFVITWDIDGNICKLSSFVEMLSSMASVLNLVAVSVERFLVIVYPIRARQWCTVTKSRRSLILVWSSAIVLSLPIVLNKNIYPITYYNNETSLTAYYCWESDDHWALSIAIYQLLTLFVIPALLMIICYFRVIKELWTSTKVITILTTPSYNSNGIRVHKDGQSYLVRFNSKRRFDCQSCQSSHMSDNNMDFNPSNNTNISSNNNSNENNYNNTNSHTCQTPVTDIRSARKKLYFQVIKMLLFIIAIFLGCWGPRLVMNVIITMGLTNYNQFTYSARVAFYLLSFIHSALNPFVYGFMSSNFRRMMLNSCNANNSQFHQNGSIMDIAATSSCINMSHLNTGQSLNRRHNSDCYEPSFNVNPTIDITTNNDFLLKESLNLRTSISDGFQTNQNSAQFPNSSHSY